jgi:predicted extracellular nuclease
MTLAIGAVACSHKPTTNKDLVVGFYNVENLFDTEDDPQIADEDFLPEGRLQWTNERYQTKLTKLATVIASIGDSVRGPAILGVCEIENERVLNDLVVTEILKPLNYSIVHHNSPDGRGIDVALLYKSDRFTVLSSDLHAITLPNEPDFKTRSILLVQGLVGKKDTLNILINHWPSKRGGDEESRYKRVAAAKVLAGLRDSLLSINPGAKIIAMGDFNDEPESVAIHQELVAYATTDSLTSLHAFYNPLAIVKQEGQGSYRYRDQWNMLDQLMLSKGTYESSRGYKYVPNSAQVFNPYWLQQHGDKYEGYPNRTYAGNNYLAGYSDHFPVFLRLSR